MGGQSHNDRITNLALPERRIPVLIESIREKSHGFVASGAWSDKRVTSVRRLDMSFVTNLRSSQGRKEIEREHGTIKTADWNRLREVVALLDRLNTGDWSPTVASKLVEGSMEEIHQGKGDQGVDEMLLTGRYDFGQGQGHMRLRVTHSKHSPIEKAPLASEALPHPKPGADNNDEAPQWSVNILSEYERTCTFDYETAGFVLSDELTAGLGKTRFVVWWAEPEKKPAPGLYCPDLLTGLYVLAMWSSGTPGGLAICPWCSEVFLRENAKRRFCNPNCQAADGMQRKRNRDKAKRMSDGSPSSGS